MKQKHLHVYNIGVVNKNSSLTRSFSYDTLRVRDASKYTQIFLVNVEET